MEVTEIILTKVSRLCKLLNHSRGFLCRLKIFKSIGPSLWISLAHKTLSYDSKMLLKVVLDKTLFVKFNISNNFKQNIDNFKQNIHKKTIQPMEFKTTFLETFAKCL
jgi:hypothetical protein